MVFETFVMVWRFGRYRVWGLGSRFRLRGFGIQAWDFGVWDLRTWDAG